VSFGQMLNGPRAAHSQALEPTFVIESIKLVDSALKAAWNERGKCLNLA
jgi:hypothetical protein